MTALEDKAPFRCAGSDDCFLGVKRGYIWEGAGKLELRRACFLNA